MTECQPGPLIEPPLSDMEACVRISFLMRLGARATDAELCEVVSLEQGLPGPCTLCPRRTAEGLGPLDSDDEAFVQPAGKPCMLPAEARSRAKQALDMCVEYTEAA